jgi:hypothetical protein
MKIKSKKVKLTEVEYKEIFDIFKKISLSGKIPTFEQFKINVDKFIEITIDAYVSNLGSKEKAIRKWKKYIGSNDVAYDYFRAVDTWHAYT